MNLSKREIFFILFVPTLILTLISGCKKMDQSKYTVIPRPLDLEGGEGQFTVNGNTRIIIEKGNKSLRPVAD